MPETRAGDLFYSLVLFRLNNGRFPTLTEPDFNDAMFYLKGSADLANPLRVFVTDKEYVKYYVAAKLGWGYTVPTIRVIDNCEDALKTDYPPDCVIKPTHLSGHVLHRRRESPVDLHRVSKWFQFSHYRETREVNYKSLKPKVIVEPLAFDRFPCDDIKIFCFRGMPTLIQSDTGRSGPEHRRSFHSPTWQVCPISVGCPAHESLAPPKNLDELLRIASRLSEPFSFMRVDLYTDGKDVYVGELTSCPGGSFSRFATEEEGFLRLKATFGDNLPSWLQPGSS